MSDWIDISVPLESGISVWPDDPPVRIERFSSMSDGDPCNVSEMSMSVHAGTHVDAPSHFVDGGIDVAHVPVSVLCGPARMISIAGVRGIGPDELAPHCPERSERLLIKTDNSLSKWWTEPFCPDFCHLTPDGARFLADAGVLAVGIDYLSVGAPGDQGDAVHRCLLPAGVTIIEGLVLDSVPWGRCELMCLPLRIAGCDGAPARALLRPV